MCFQASLQVVQLGVAVCDTRIDTEFGRLLLPSLQGFAALMWITRPNPVLRRDLPRVAASHLVPDVIQLGNLLTQRSKDVLFESLLSFVGK